MRPFHITCLLLSVLFFQACSSEKTVSSPTTLTIFVGTYTQKLGHVDGKATGIYTCKFDLVTGVLTVVDSTTDIVNPSFLTVSPDHKYLYAVAETGGSPEIPFGRIAAYRIQEDGKLQKINAQSSFGAAPCHVSTDRTGKFVFVANYSTGNVLSYGVQPDGSLTDSLCMVQHPGTSPWAHMIVPSPDNSRIWAVDKGADKLFIYQLSKEGKLLLDQTISVDSGAGPRHLDFHPQDSSVFAVINESNSRLFLGRRHKFGALTIFNSMPTLRADFTGKNSCADIHFHPNGKFLYGSNRGDNSIVIYKVDAANGVLTYVGHAETGATPRNFMITPDGAWLLAANQDSSTVSIFKIDAATGNLTLQGTPTHVATPVCLKVL